MRFFSRKVKNKMFSNFSCSFTSMTLKKAFLLLKILKIHKVKRIVLWILIDLSPSFKTYKHMTKLVFLYNNHLFFIHTQDHFEKNLRHYIISSVNILCKTLKDKNFKNITKIPLPHLKKNQTVISWCHSWSTWCLNFSTCLIIYF